MSFDFDIVYAEDDDELLLVYDEGAGGAVGGATNITIGNRTATSFDVESSTGDNGTVPAATQALAGAMSAADKTKLDGLNTPFNSRGAYADRTAYAVGDLVTYDNHLWYVATAVPDTNTAAPTDGTTWVLLTADPTPDASETVAGKVELATTAEMNAGTADKVPDAAKVKAYADGIDTTPSDDEITPAMLDADTNTKKEAFRTRIGVDESGTLPAEDSITPAMLDADDATKQAALRTRIGAGTSSFSGNFDDLTGAPSTFNRRGAYADNTAYAVGDVVTYSNKLFYVAAPVANTNTTKPVDGTTWVQLDADPTPDATESVKGSVELSTAAEMTAGDADTVPTSKRVKDFVDANATPDASETVKGKVELATAQEVASSATDKVPTAKRVVDWVTNEIPAKVKELFTPKSTDRWFQVNSDFAHWSQDNYAEIGFYTGTPSASNNVQDLNQNNPNWAGITHIRMTKRAWNNSDYFNLPEHADTDVPAPSVGDTLIVHADDEYVASPYLSFAVTAVDSSDSRFYQLTVTTTVVGGTFSSGGNNFVKVTDTVPIGITIPVSNVSGIQTSSFLDRLVAIPVWYKRVSKGVQDLLNSGANDDAPARTALARSVSTFLATLRSSNDNVDAAAVTAFKNAVRDTINDLYARLDGSNLTNIFKNDVRSPSDPYTFAGNYTRKGNSTDGGAITVNGQFQFNNTPVLKGANVQLDILFRNLDLTPATDRWLVGNEFVFGAGIYTIKGTPVHISGNRYSASIQLTAGTVEAVDAIHTPRLQPDNPHRSEFSKVALKDNLTGQGGKFAQVNSGATDFDFVDAPGGGITVQDEGTALATDASTVNFKGDLVKATGTGATKDIEIDTMFQTPLRRNFYRGGPGGVSNAIVKSANSGSNFNARGIAIDSDGNLYIGDMDNDKVYAFKDGARVSAKDISQTIIQSASSSIVINGLSFDEDGDLLVLDSHNDAIWGFQFTSNAWSRKSSKDIAQSVLRSANSAISPVSLAVGSDGTRYVSHYASNASAIYAFTSAGARDSSKDVSTAQLTAIDSELPYGVNGLAIDASDVMYASAGLELFGIKDGVANTNGDFSRNLITTGTGNWNYAIYGATINSDGLLYLLSGGPHVVSYGTREPAALSDQALSLKTLPHQAVFSQEKSYNLISGSLSTATGEAKITKLATPVSGGTHQLDLDYTDSSGTDITTFLKGLRDWWFRIETNGGVVFGKVLNLGDIVSGTQTKALYFVPIGDASALGTGVAKVTFYNPNKPALYQRQGKRAELRGPKTATGNFVYFPVLIDPSSTTAKLKVRGILHGRSAGNTNNKQRHTVAIGRWKVNSGSDWKAFIDQTDDYSVLGYKPVTNTDYGDWNIDDYPFEFEFTPGTTSRIQIQVGFRTNDQPGGNNFVSDAKYFNRALNNSVQDLAGNDSYGAIWSFLEVTEMVAVDNMDATPISVSNVTTLLTAT